MDRNQLLATLQTLRAELAGLETIDPPTREALDRLADEVHRLADPDDEANDPSAAREGLGDLLLRFEVEHPQVAQTLGRLADGLANLGI